MIHIPFLKRLLIFLGAEMYMIGIKKSEQYLLTFQYQPHQLGKRAKLLLIIRAKWDLKFLLTGKLDALRMPS